MKKIMSFLDYIFYRTYKFFKRNGDNISSDKAINLIVLLVCFIFIDIFIFIRKIVEFEINLKYYNKWVWGATLFLIIAILIHKRYKRKFKNDNYSTFESEWSKEEKKLKIIKGWLIILFLIFVIFTLPLLAILN